MGYLRGFSQSKNWLKAQNRDEWALLLIVLHTADRYNTPRTELLIPYHPCHHLHLQSNRTPSTQWIRPNIGSLGIPFGLPNTSNPSIITGNPKSIFQTQPFLTISAITNLNHSYLLFSLLMAFPALFLSLTIHVLNTNKSSLEIQDRSCHSLAQ